MAHRRRTVIASAVLAVVAPTVIAVAAPADPTQLDVQNHTGPSAVATADATTVPDGTVVTFDGHASHNADGTPVRDYRWDFGDGSQAVGPIAHHRFLTDGVYQARLIVHDAMGASGGQKILVNVGTVYSKLVTDDVMIPTRYGYSLHATVTRPDAPGQFPVLMEYGPYLDGAFSDNIETLAVESGYVKMHVEAPGRGGSGGHFDLFGDETRYAGYDAVEWAAAQPWSTGKVALVGYSGPAVGALTVAGSRPPHLAAVVARNSYTDLYRDLAYPGGIHNSNTFIQFWISYFLGGQDTLYTGNTAAPNPQLFAQRWQDEAALASDVAAHPLFDSFWRQRKLSDYPVSAPILYVGSTHDLWPRSAFEMYHWIAPAGGKVVLTPGGHSTPDVSGWEIGGFSDGVARGWLDHYLKGVDNNVENRPSFVAYAARGGDASGTHFDLGRWVSLPDWPGNGVDYQSLYLDATPRVDDLPFRSLADAPPSAAPGNLPTPLVVSPGSGATTDNTPNYEAAASGAQAPDDAQNIVFETPSLDHDLTVVGPVTVHLWSTLAAADLAFAVHLNDVWPDGSSNYVSSGFLQASQADTYDTADSLSADGQVVRPFYAHDTSAVVAPGTLREYVIEVWGVANTFGAGHRLRFTVAGQNVAWRASVRSGPAALIYSDDTHPSRVVLPTVSPGYGQVPFPFIAPQD